jgi:hypothetical protein
MQARRIKVSVLAPTDPMPHRIPHLVLVLAAVSSTSLAQRPQRTQPAQRTNELLAAAALPVSAAQARREGASNREVRDALRALRENKVPAHEARLVIDEERSARKANGPVDNFGAFVQTKLKAGLRGKDLAAAIKAEHVARGKGKAVAKTNTKATATKAKSAGGAKAGAPTKTSAKQSQAKTKGKAPATKAPATKARPTGRTAKPNA